jgi:hypothetical protein
VWLGAALALLLGASPAACAELWRHGDASLELGGSARELLVGTHGTDLDSFRRNAAADFPNCIQATPAFPNCAAWDALNDAPVVTSLTRLRVELDARATERLSALIVYDHEVAAGTLNTLGQQIGEALQGDTLLRADQIIVDAEHVRWRHVLYRGYLFYESPHFELVLGRQRIPWGVGRLWNPIDRFNPIPPLALEADQAPGVDAVTARWLLSGFTFLEGIFAPLRELDDGSYAARLHGVIRDVDYSLVGGVFREALTLGFDLAGNVGDAAGRLEVVWSDPSRKVRPLGQDVATELSDFWQVVASVDHVFDLGTGLYVLVEHLYNGNGLGFGAGKAGPLLGFFEETDLPPDPSIPPSLGPFVTPATLDIFGGSQVVTFAENQTGFQVGYDLTPEVRGDLLVLYDWDGSSAAFFPAFRYSPLDWLELTLGAQLYVGPHRSQFGALEPLGFVLAEVFL